MTLHFSKSRHLLIRSSSMRINLQILPLILVVTAIEVSQATASSAANESSSSSLASSYSRHFYFSLFLNRFQKLLSKTLLFFIMFSSFFCVDFALFVASILSFSSRQSHEFSGLILCLCWARNHIFLIGIFKLPTDSKYQNQKLRRLWIDYLYDLPLFKSQS